MDEIMWIDLFFMKRIRFTLCALAVFWMLLGAAKAQTTFLIGYDSLNFPDPDTSSFGNSVRYEFDMQNVSGSSFSDTLRFMIRVNGGLPQLLGDSGIVTIGPALTKHFIFDDTVSALRYGGNINIVVIWPTSPSPIAVDSMYGMLFVYEGMGLKDGWDFASFDVGLYPVPTEAVLYTRLKEPQVRVLQTQLTNVMGNVLWKEDGLPSEILMSDFSAGIYFVRVTLEDGRIGRFKVIKR
jgi:hypothetical protein